MSFSLAADLSYVARDVLSSPVTYNGRTTRGLFRRVTEVVQDQAGRAVAVHATTLVVAADDAVLSAVPLEAQLTVSGTTYTVAGIEHVENGRGLRLVLS
jgi:hypothetical protein